jgi:hypothetical protein
MANAKKTLPEALKVVSKNPNLSYNRHTRKTFSL